MTADRANSGSDLPYLSVLKPFCGGTLSESYGRALFKSEGPSPTCLKQGHDWGPPAAGAVKAVQVRGCRRCARRGYYVTVTESAW